MANAFGFSILKEMNRLGKVKIEWNSKFAYAIGLLTTDGNLSKDGRHLNMTSKDEELILIFRSCLGLQNKIGKKARGGSLDKKYFVLQFGDRNFYDFLVGIGLKQAKSKTLEELNIPKEYFWDFLRGCIDGDGSIGIFKHPESRHSQLRIRLYSASPIFLNWLKETIVKNSDLKGGWIEIAKKNTSVYKLVFAKEDSVKLFKLIYNNSECFLNRKYKVAEEFI